MTLEEKVGQMVQVEWEHLEDINDIKTLHIGSLLHGAHTRVEPNTYEHWVKQLKEYSNPERNIENQSHGIAKYIPIIFGIDAVHGLNSIPGSVLYPHNIGLGCTRNENLIKQIAYETAISVRSLGIRWSFSPCVAIPQDIRWGRTYEGFSEDQELVSRFATAYVKGMQGNLNSNDSLLACCKHFIADGGTKFGTSKWLNRQGLDRGDTQIDEQELRRIHLQPYLKCVEAQVGTIMISYSSWNNIKCSAHKYLLTDILKNELGFDGFLISDYNAIDALSKDYKHAVLQIVRSGIDMIMVSDKYRLLIKCIKELVNNNQLNIERINDAVIRILRVKLALGLFNDNNSNNGIIEKNFHTNAQQNLARQAVRESLVLLKNKFHTLPVSNDNKIIVIGNKANCLLFQYGGWSIRHQGAGYCQNENFITIFDAFKARLKEKVDYSEDASSINQLYDKAIIVIGEQPYAELLGDKQNLDLNLNDIDLIKEVKQHC